MNPLHAPIVDTCLLLRNIMMSLVWLIDLYAMVINIERLQKEKCLIIGI